MKTFYNLTGAYAGLRGRRVARKGRLFLFKIFEEDYKPCKAFWLIYIQNFDLNTDGLRCKWFIRGTSIVSTAPGKHLLREAEGRAWFERLAPNFTDLPKRPVSADTLQRLEEARKKLQAKRDQNHAV